MLDSAIPDHLRVERDMPASTPPNYAPPFPTYSSRFGNDVTNLVMAVIGAQCAAADDENVDAAVGTLARFLASAVDDADARPTLSDWAAVVDRKGFYNVAVVAYWRSTDAYEGWSTASGFRSWWEGLDAAASKHGWFLEVFFPTMDRIETVFSDQQTAEGASLLRQGVTGPIREHVYWGSMRDRLAVGQTQRLEGEKRNGRGGAAAAAAAATGAARIRVGGRRNLAVIRSGQDWLDTSADERELYLSTMHPVLVKGMDFLRDEGDEVGCHSCRFMDVIDGRSRKADKDKTFGLAYFDNLGSLERWSKEHASHLAIFGGFLQYAAKLGGHVTLRLFHEVLVLTPEQQLFEYVACHPDTGMLAAARQGACA
ncbi:hypothetical protein RJ55_01978 [Drechmeria coniospora]|nr:hypothetical protein RJ55_01978 [Drechmeria coniospora]